MEGVRPSDKIRWENEFNSLIERQLDYALGKEILSSVGTAKNLQKNGNRG